VIPNTKQVQDAKLAAAVARCSITEVHSALPIPKGLAVTIVRVVDLGTATK
jgi:hypothetical protein